MASSFRCGRFLHIAALAMVAGGCVGSGSSDQNPQLPDPPSNRTPTISGSPSASVRVDEPYDFTPNASDPDGDELTFVVRNRPAWAIFDLETGRLRGTPGAGDVGRYDGISIVVSDGTAAASLDSFSISVDQVANGSVTVSWTPPTMNSDGTAITDLAGYRIYYGRAPDDLEHTVDIGNPGTTRWVVENLSPATWYFSMTSVNRLGLESARSPVDASTIT